MISILKVFYDTYSPRGHVGIFVNTDLSFVRVAHIPVIIFGLSLRINIIQYFSNFHFLPKTQYIHYPFFFFFSSKKWCLNWWDLSKTKRLMMYQNDMYISIIWEIQLLQQHKRKKNTYTNLTFINERRVL